MNDKLSEMVRKALFYAGMYELHTGKGQNSAALRLLTGTRTMVFTVNRRVASERGNPPIRTWERGE